MNSPTNLDYEAQLRERKTQEQRAAAQLRIKVRAVARLLGGRYVDDAPENSGHAIELAPTVHLWARHAWQKKGMIQWGARCPLAPNAAVSSVYTAAERSVAAIAADLRRRLVPAAHAACKTAMSSAARERDIEHTRRARLAELAQVLGPLRSGHDRMHYADGFAVRHDDLLGGGVNGRYCAEVRVHSWHCLLMIAKLIAEDTRVAASTTERDEC